VDRKVREEKRDDGDKDADQRGTDDASRDESQHHDPVEGIGDTSSSSMVRCHFAK
jgi:hypothetical protein